METDPSIYFLTTLANKILGGKPIITLNELNRFQHRIFIKNSENIFHLASVLNEPEIIKFILYRYNYSPNIVASGSHLSIWLQCISLTCWEVMEVFIIRDLYPETWYIFLLAIIGYDKYELLQYITENVKRTDINLSNSETVTLITNLGQKGHSFTNYIKVCV